MPAKAGSYNFHRHLKTHARFAKFQCPEQGCKKTFTRFDNYERHYRSQHHALAQIPIPSLVDNTITITDASTSQSSGSNDLTSKVQSTAHDLAFIDPDIVTQAVDADNARVEKAIDTTNAMGERTEDIPDLSFLDDQNELLALMGGDYYTLAGLDSFYEDNV